jgi:hypothetical protein
MAFPVSCDESENEEKRRKENELKRLRLHSFSAPTLKIVKRREFARESGRFFLESIYIASASNQYDNRYFLRGTADQIAFARETLMKCAGVPEA